MTGFPDEAALCVVDLGGIAVRVEPRLLWNIHTGMSPGEFVEAIRHGGLIPGDGMIESFVNHRKET